MIKVFLKYLIYEKCISIMFDALTKNFQKDPGQIRVGDVFNTIEIYEHCHQSSTMKLIDITTNLYYNVTLIQLDDVEVFGKKMQFFTLQEVENKNQQYYLFGILKSFNR